MEAEYGFSKIVECLAGNVSAATCQQCGACSSVCPQVGYPGTVRQVLQAVNSGLRAWVLNSELVQACSVCGRCSEVCPENIEVAEIVYALKRLSLASRADRASFFQDCFGQLARLMVEKTGTQNLEVLLQKEPIALLAFGPLALSMVEGKEVRIPSGRQATLEEVRVIYHASMELDER